MSFAVKAVGGGVLAILGLVLARFMLGLFGAGFAFLMFFLVKVVPLVLLGFFVVWLFRKLKREETTA
jgi:hypothetical protein